MGMMVRRGSVGVLRLVTALLGVVLGVFCRRTEPEPLYGVVAEYGVPAAEYRVDGVIRDAATSQGIPNILVSLRDTGMEAETPIDTSRTDSGGAYSLATIRFPEEQLWTVRAEDTDGANNGSYESKDTTVGFTTDELSGGDGSWDAGTARKNVDMSVDPS
jgi:putative lipoprotein (rSAM/lipoprotein system)